jgi:phage baseplate assembly protein W
MTTLNGFRLVAVRRGDSLQGIASRTLGDAALWRQLVWINGLTYPYLTDDPSQASGTVILAGGLIKVPATSVQSSTTVDPALLYGVDLALIDGDLAADALGDLAVVSGVDNLTQALEGRLATPLGELIWHPTYGNGVFSLLGGDNGPEAGQLSQEYVASCLRADPRVAGVQSVVTTVGPDSIGSEAVVVPKVGAPIVVTSQT